MRAYQHHVNDRLGCSGVFGQHKCMCGLWGCSGCDCALVIGGVLGRCSVVRVTSYGVYLLNLLLLLLLSSLLHTLHFLLLWHLFSFDIFPFLSPLAHLDVIYWCSYWLHCHCLLYHQGSSKGHYCVLKAFWKGAGTCLHPLLLHVVEFCIEFRNRFDSTSCDCSSSGCGCVQ